MENEQNRLSVIVSSTIIVIVLLCVAFILNVGGISSSRPESFSKNNMLQALWYQYKANYLEPTTLRALDKQRNYITTSEGQSYTMLRAVEMDDKTTFDAAWQWTKDNLQHKQDHLISWLFGKRADGSYGILVNQGGQNTASDADEDIALSLLFAWKRWGDQQYFGDAILVIRDIWSREVITVNGQPYLVADDVEKAANKPTAIINPSYLAPYAYKMFADVDSGHNWLGLVATSYSVINQSMRLPLDKGSTDYLVPDWVAIDKTTGVISAPPASSGLDTNFSFDAMRVPWRLALDYNWFGDQNARTILGKMNFLQTQWKSHGALYTLYDHGGQATTTTEAPAMYGGAMGYFVIADTADAASIYKNKLEALYNPALSKWLSPQSYYDENWAWFGMALYDNEFQNLYADAPKQGNAGQQ